ncbi:MAG: adenylate/guanylate cyclase domain-containing protein [Betaproteobacteria bacterium]|nr:adenylate/guanylate cyclase domain-containing protein [Betaproteobacteria bacterium]
MGGFVVSSGILLLSMLAPLGALLAYGRRGSLPWFAAYAAVLTVSVGWDYYFADESVPSIPGKTVGLFAVLNGAVLSTIAFFLLRHLVGQREQAQDELGRQHALLQAEREMSETLLRSLLPPYIAARLKREAGLIADGHADVTVMFADMVGFTRLAGDLEPRQVVGLLNHVFTRMDHLCAQHGLEKIKTIGDAYMVVGGLNYEMDAYVEAMADMALQLQQTFALDPIVSKYDIAFHVGIATGPAVAGVIGTTRFSYDVWGDTVNLASRLTTDATGGSILVDGNTHARLAGRYEFGDPVELPLKGKGRVTAHRLLGRRIRDQVPKTERQRDITASLSRTRSPGATRA